MHALLADRRSQAFGLTDMTCQRCLGNSASCDFADEIPTPTVENSGSLRAIFFSCLGDTLIRALHWAEERPSYSVCLAERCYAV